jgi:multidrug efflux system membrane fusion protein
VTVQPPAYEDVTVFREFSGRLEAESTVDVRARVQGFLRSVEFVDGETVRGPSDGEPGQVLFTIEPEPFEARLNAARAALAQAEASRDLAKAVRDRTKAALDQQAVNELEMMEREAELAVAEAAVLAARADVESAEIDLGYTTIRAPMGGRASRALVSEGNLVGGLDATLLTTIVRDDPMYAYVDVSERELLEFVEGRGRRPDGQAADDPPPDIFLETADGVRFPMTGRFDFAETRLDPATGTLQGRAEFPNPEGALYPGMFVRLLVPQLTGEQFLVPDAVVQRDLAGRFVLIVGEGNVVERRSVETAQAVEGRRIITAGLAADDRVIVNGLQRAFPGAVVNPQPAPAQPQQPSDASADEAGEE